MDPLLAASARAETPTEMDIARGARAATTMTSVLGTDRRHVVVPSTTTRLLVAAMMTPIVATTRLRTRT